MKTRRGNWVWMIGLLVGAATVANATVTLVSITPAPAAPQVIGKPITWTAKATDSNSGPLTFQFNVAPPGGALALVKDYNVGTLRSGTWTAQPFYWTPTGIEGSYQIEVIAKDFTSGESDSKTVSFQVNPLITGNMPVVAVTVNPLVALFSAPSCAAGSSMRVHFQPHSKSAPATTTNYMSCHPPYSMTFEIGGMYAGTAYDLFSQTLTGGKIANGPTVSFTTGSLPHNITFPAFTVNIPPGPQTDITDRIVLNTFSQFGGQPNYADVASDLNGNIVWFYNAPAPFLITRPLANGTMLTVQTGAAWYPSMVLQFLRQIDLIGNIIKETNIGIVAEQLTAMGASDLGLCTAVAKPAPVGSACLGAFHHDAIQTLPNGYTAVIADVEKIYPPGTQGDTSGLPVDIIGDAIIVLDRNWQVAWYFDAFQHAAGAPELDVNRAAPLGETCSINEQGCPPMFLLGSGIASLAKDWLHANTLYYWPQTKDIIWSLRNQDWVVKIDYNNMAGTGNILWRMGPCGDFTFNNVYMDAWPWFSGQHEVDFENNGAGYLTLFDNGNTRVSPPTGPGSSTGCLPGLGSGNSRGMALSVNEATMQVQPVVSANLGVFSTAGGSAQLLSNSNYFFDISVILLNLTTEVSSPVEILPSTSPNQATQVYNLQGPVGYRAWQMSSLYNPPLT